jgi:hypothetical protein
MLLRDRSHLTLFARMYRYSNTNHISAVRGQYLQYFVPDISCGSKICY